MVAGPVVTMAIGGVVFTRGSLMTGGYPDSLCMVGLQDGSRRVGRTPQIAETKHSEIESGHRHGSPSLMLTTLTEDSNYDSALLLPSRNHFTSRHFQEVGEGPIVVHHRRHGLSRLQKH